MAPPFTMPSIALGESAGASNGLGGSWGALTPELAPDA
jgi:hypothetical protein